MREDADFNVLMIGPRRAGKSSVLSAMLKSIELLGNKTGYSFKADSGTEIVMREKLSELEKLFVLHANDPETPFSTLLGQEDGIEYSPFTSNAIPYRFVFSFSDKKKTKNSYTVEFTDIPGEQMTSDLEQSENTVIERFIKSDVVIVAIDSPALMEGDPDEEIGEFHQMVNIPDSIYNVITVSDCRMRENIKEDQKIAPKMILFVPLKCEKYYHEGSMDELNKRVKIGYQDTLSYLTSCAEYTVAITPILTVGDIVFDHYGTKANAKGRERVAILGRDSECGLSNIPEFPLYKIRSPECKTINPMYCEQPLLYLTGYIMGRKQILEKANYSVEKMQLTKKKKGIKDVGKVVVVAIAFGLLGVSAYFLTKGLKRALSDKSFVTFIEKLAQNIKISGDGYEIIQDNLGISEVVKAYAANV